MHWNSVEKRALIMLSTVQVHTLQQKNNAVTGAKHVIILHLQG